MCPNVVYSSLRRMVRARVEKRFRAWLQEQCLRAPSTTPAFPVNRPTGHGSTIAEEVKAAGTSECPVPKRNEFATELRRYDCAPKFPDFDAIVFRSMDSTITDSPMDEK